MPTKEVFDPKEWFEDVSKGVELSEEQVQARDLLLANPDIAKNIGNSVLRQSDYSRKSDELKAQREAVDAELATAGTKTKEADDFVTKMRDRDHNNVTLHDQLVADLAKANKSLSDAGEETIVSRVTAPEGKEKPEAPVLTVKDYEEREAARDANTIQFSSRLITMSNEHQKTFGESFDPAPVVAYATEKGLNLDDAYKELNAERFTEATEAAVQKRIDTAVQEKEIELRSKNDFPEIDSGPQRVSGLDQKEEDKLKTEGDRARAAVHGLAEVRAGKRTVTDIYNH